MLRGVDTSTIKGLLPTETEYLDLHPWQYVGFRSVPQITPYDKLFRVYGTGAEDTGQEWVIDRLSEYYPAPLVKRAVAACKALPAPTVTYAYARQQDRPPAVRYRAQG